MTRRRLLSVYDSIGRVAGVWSLDTHSHSYNFIICIINAVINIICQLSVNLLFWQIIALNTLIWQLNLEIFCLANLSSSLNYFFILLLQFSYLFSSQCCIKHVIKWIKKTIRRRHLTEITSHTFNLSIKFLPQINNQLISLISNTNNHNVYIIISFIESCIEI